MDPQPPLDSWLFFEQAAFRADQQALAHPFEQLRCPINLGIEVFGDKWAVLIIRDMMLAGKRHFRFPGLGRRHFQPHPGASPSRAAEVCITTRAAEHRVKGICLLTEPLTQNNGVGASLPACAGSSSSSSIGGPSGAGLGQATRPYRKSVDDHQSATPRIGTRPNPIPISWLHLQQRRA